MAATNTLHRMLILSLSTCSNCTNTMLINERRRMIAHLCVVWWVWQLIHFRKQQTSFQLSATLWYFTNFSKDTCFPHPRANTNIRIYITNIADVHKLIGNYINTDNIDASLPLKTHVTILRDTSPTPTHLHIDAHWEVTLWQIHSRTSCRLSTVDVARLNCADMPHQ